MKKKKAFVVMGFLLLLCLSACSKEKEAMSENIEAVVESETIEPASETTETQVAMAEDVIPTDYAAAIIVTINPQIKLYVDADNTIIGIE